MYCRHCGSATSEYARFCAGCGQPTEPSSSRTVRASEPGRLSGADPLTAGIRRSRLLPGIIVAAVVSIVLIATVAAAVLLYPSIAGRGGLFGTAAAASDLSNIPAGDLVIELDVPQLSKSIGSWVEGEPDTRALYSKALADLRIEVLKDGVDLDLVERVSVSAWEPNNSGGPRFEFVAYVVGRFDTSRFEWSASSSRQPLDTYEDIRMFQLTGKHGVGAVVGPGAFYIGSTRDAVRRAIDARAGREPTASADTESSTFRDSLGSSQALRASYTVSAAMRERLARDSILGARGAATVRYIGAALDVTQGCNIEVEVRTVTSAAAAAVPANMAALLDDLTLVPVSVRGSALWRSTSDAMTVTVDGDRVRVSVAKPQSVLVSQLAELLTQGRQASQESAAIGTLRSLGSAQATFQHFNGGRAANLDELVSAGNIDSALREGAIINGFRFTTARVSATEWEFKAEPVDPSRHSRAFNITSDFVIRFRQGPIAPDWTNGEPLG